MIRHELTPADILRQLSSSDQLPQTVDRPSTDLERAEAGAAVAEMVATDTDKIRTLCIACHQESPLLQSALCQCGGFVCQSCQATEEEGVCPHEQE